MTDRRAFLETSAAAAPLWSGPPPIDSRSGSGCALPGRLRDDEAALHAFNESDCVDCINPRPYVALFLAGGHGALWDCPKSESLRRILERTAADDKPIGAVGQGPAAFLCVHINGRPLRLNFEFNLEYYDEALARIEGARRLDGGELRSQPLPARLRNGLARLLSPYL